MGDEEEEEQTVEIERGSEENLAFAMKHVMLIAQRETERERESC